MKKISLPLLLIVGFQFLPLSTFAQGQPDIWQLHAQLLVAEQQADVDLIPLVEQLTTQSEINVSLQLKLLDQREKLEFAQHQISAAFRALGTGEQARFIDALNQRSLTEVLMYEFGPFLDRISKVNDLRFAQQDRLTADVSGRAHRAGILHHDEIEIDHTVTTEINGNSFPDNHFSFTFDDGPLPAITNKILDTLAQRGVSANFFQCGNRIERLSGMDLTLLAKIHTAGHGVENHSWDHPQMTKLPLGDARDQVVRTFDIIAENLRAFVYQSFLFRFPYGARNAALKGMIREPAIRATSVMWNIDTLDWKYKDPETIISITQRQIEKRNRGIILMHDIHRQTSLALPTILQLLAERQATTVRLRVTGQ